MLGRGQHRDTILTDIPAHSLGDLLATLCTPEEMKAVEYQMRNSEVENLTLAVKLSKKINDAMSLEDFHFLKNQQEFPRLQAHFPKPVGVFQVASVTKLNTTDRWQEHTMQMTVLVTEAMGKGVNVGDHIIALADAEKQREAVYTVFLAMTTSFRSRSWVLRRTVGCLEMYARETFALSPGS